MKHFLLFGISLLLFTSFIKKKDKLFIPPGTVQINDTFFVDETEVSNFTWLEFEYWTRKSNGINFYEATSTLPDTLIWEENGLWLGGPDITCYYRHPVFRDYPVVGINYEQALAFCKWRTEVVHIWLEIKSGKRKEEDRHKPYTGKKMFEYRLPSKKEWESFAMIGTDQKIREKYLRSCKCTDAKSKKIKCSDTLLLANISNYFKGDFTTNQVYIYPPNKLGIYNLIGNVSEMVMEEGISKGGSWRSAFKNISIWKNDHSGWPNSSVGLRCVCVMKK